MITGFEEITDELSDFEEKTILPKLVNELKTRIGKETQITNKEMRDLLLYFEGIKINDSRIRKIINYIRVNQLVKNLISNNRGYWVASSDEEVKKYVKSLTERINEINRVRSSFLV